MQLLVSAAGKDVDARIALCVGDHMRWNWPEYGSLPPNQMLINSRRWATVAPRIVV